MASDTQREEPATKGYVDAAVEHLVEVIHSSDESVKSELRQEMTGVEDRLSEKIKGSEGRVLQAIEDLKSDTTERISNLEDRVATLEYKS